MSTNQAATTATEVAGQGLHARSGEFEQLLQKPVSVYDKISDPTEFSDHAAKSYASLAGAPAEHGFAIAMTCLAENITIHEYCRRFHCINGRPVPKSDWMLARLRSMGGGHEVVRRTANEAKIRLVYQGKETEASFTWKEAQESRWPWKDWKDHDKGLKDNWATPTDRKSMLWHRLVSDTIGAVAPEISVGGDTLDEALDAEMIRHPDGKPGPRKTTAEIMQANLERAGVLETPAADLQVRWTTTEAATTTVAESAPAEQPAEQPAAEEKPQRHRVLTACRLVDELQIPEQSVQSMLAKRDAKAFDALTDEQLDEIIAKLEAKQRQLKN